MDFLEIVYYENTIQAYLISLVAFALSLIISKRAYSILREALPKWLNRVAIELDINQIVPAATGISLLLPLVGLTIAKNHLQLPRHLVPWTNIALLVLGQIVFLFVLTRIFNWVVEVRSSRHLKIVEEKRPKYLGELKESFYRIKKHINTLSVVLLVLVPVSTILFTMGMVPVAAWLIPAVVLMIMLALYSRISLRARRKLTDGEINEIAEESLAISEESVDPDDEDRKIRESVVEFFLDLYKLQSGASDRAPAKVFRVDSTSSSTNYIYELRVKIDNKWTSRRMTIGPLGEEAGSRSKCFYVIYDVHLVVKIPPVPIADFYEYLQLIRKEARIVDKLAMKESIVPRISVILKMVYPFRDENSMRPEELEKKYIKWVWNSANFQKHLKIGNTFVFFMDLSEYYFLQHIMEMLHDNQEKMYKEISGHSEILSDPAELAKIYGHDNLPTFLEIQKIFTNYELEVKRLIERFGASFSTFQYQIKSWFFNRLFGNDVVITKETLSSEFIDDLNTVLDRIIMNNTDTIGAYVETLKKSMDKVTFLQNKSRIEGIITNLLALLAKLRKRCVAMRDLKPDNLLVAGDRSSYPKFLSYPEQYTIGLIDVETAVVLGTSMNKNIDQPLLGGTPQYATPSHFLENDVLGQTYDDLQSIFYLQDWHALIVMFYKLITGDFLFQQTSQLLPEILKIIKTLLPKTRQVSDIVEHVSSLFWRKAVAEFERKVAEKAEILNAVKISVPDLARKMFREFVEKEKQILADRIREQVNSQTIFTSAKNRQYLISCPCQDISKLKQKWEEANGTQESVVVGRGEIRKFLQNLEMLKLKSEECTQTTVFLQNEEPVMSGYELLDLLFGVVLNHMYDMQWSDCSPTDLTGHESAQGDVSRQATI